ncbi:MAG: deoxyribose-phosphate aldolase [Acidilobaceae archaeon]
MSSIAERLEKFSRVELRELSSMIESTLLDPVARLESYFRLVDEASAYGFYCVVVPSSIVGLVSGYAAERGVRLCGVAGFPGGFAPLKSKLAEVEELASRGVAEVDIVPNFALLKSGLLSELESELSTLVDAALAGGASSKVIVEAPLLSDSELEALVDVARRCRARFVKTSTGVYSKGGDPLTVRRVYELASPRGLLVKASGGIRTFFDALLALSAGASRIGTSTAGLVVETFAKFREKRG